MCVFLFLRCICKLRVLRVGVKTLYTICRNAEGVHAQRKVWNPCSRMSKQLKLSAAAYRRLKADREEKLTKYAGPIDAYV